MSLSRVLRMVLVSALSLLAFVGVAHARVVVSPAQHYVSVDMPIVRDLDDICSRDGTSISRLAAWTKAVLDTDDYRRRFCGDEKAGTDLTEAAKILAQLGVIVVTQAPPGMPDYGEVGPYWRQLLAVSLLGYNVGTNWLVAQSFLLLEGSLGGVFPLNQTDLGATQQVEREGRAYADLALFYTIFSVDPWTVMAGIQAFAGRTDNESLINAAPYAPSPFGGYTSYTGLALILAMERYFQDYGFALRTYIGAGAAVAKFQGIQNGVTTVSGRHTVPVVKAGVAAFWPVGNGWDIGAGLDFTQIDGFTVVTNTNAPLDLGETRDFTASIKFRRRFGLEDRYSEPDLSIFEDGFESGNTTSWSNVGGQ